MSKPHNFISLLLTLGVSLVFLVLCVAAAQGAASLALAADTGLAWLAPVEVGLDETGLALHSLAWQGGLWGYELKAGVIPVSWGPTPGDGLLLSGCGLLGVWAAGDFSGFEILPPLHYETFLAALGPHDGAGRYLIGRRYTFGGEALSFGLSELALLSGDFSLFYLNPYPFFPLFVTKVFLTESRVGDPRDANLLYGLDLRYAWDGGSAYAALLVDEAPLSPSYDGPYRLGAQAGAEVMAPFGWEGWTLWGEYTAISRYAFTYLPGYARGDFCDGEAALGHPLGPDADLLRLRLAKAGEDRRWWLEFSRERHGEGEFGDRWAPGGGQVLEFLTGTVETSTWLSFGAEFAVAERLDAAVGLGVARVDNLGHAPGSQGWDWRASMRLAYAF